MTKLDVYMHCDGSLDGHRSIKSEMIESMSPMSYLLRLQSSNNLQMPSLFGQLFFAQIQGLRITIFMISHDCSTRLCIFLREKCAHLASMSVIVAHRTNIDLTR